MWTMAGEFEKLTYQPRGLMPVYRNWTQKVKTVALKWVTTNCQNPDH
jgi:hypothetical protein